MQPSIIAADDVMSSSLTRSFGGGTPSSQSDRNHPIRGVQQSSSMSSFVVPLKRSSSGEAFSNKRHRGVSQSPPNTALVTTPRHQNARNFASFLSVPQPASSIDGYRGAVFYYAQARFASSPNDRLFATCRGSHSFVRLDTEHRTFDATEIVRYIKESVQNQSTVDAHDEFLRLNNDTRGLPLVFDRPVDVHNVVLLATLCGFKEHLQPLLDFAELESSLVQNYECVHCGLEVTDDDDELPKRHIAFQFGGQFSDVELVRCPVNGCDVFGVMGREVMETHLSFCAPDDQKA
ncbi:hypothetical protein FB567DRAFT_620563 [Paraphoma chrysanthemicola]|uniref:Uncharacterized protein n=1 Tax=Paraphoma chrysanthemicola TaxID=798071 RepID=A0A8K0R9L0_9PLEO|nr:hypothetical protein FB567DRAFT_620563 [Paraphoma chrysanthemicola]